VCEDLISEGGFDGEDLSAWTISGNHEPQLVSYPARSGIAALRMGLVDGESDSFGYSAIGQRVALPPGVVSADLSLWMRPLALSPGDAIVVELRRPTTGDRAVVVGPAPEIPVNEWSRYSMDVDPDTWGRSLEVYVAVLNRGQRLAPGELTSAVVDDVSLQACYVPMEHLYLPVAHRARN
jgi:hypothetical protein